MTADPRLRVLAMGPLPPQRCGVSNQLAAMLRALSDSTYFEVLTYRECGAEHELGANVKIRRLPTLFRPDQVANLRGLSYLGEAAVLAAVVAGRFHLMNPHCVAPQGLAALAAHRARGTPYVYSSHGAEFELQATRGRHAATICEAVLRHAAVVTAVDAVTARRFESLGARVLQIPVAIDDAKLQMLSRMPRRTTPTARPKLLFLGHINRHKGADLAVRTLAAIRELGYDAQLDVLGGGNPAAVAEVRTLAGALGVGPAVTFHGIVPDVAVFLRHASVLLHPTRRDGMPNAILEAFAARVPVVATSVGGVPEMLDDGMNGTLVEPEDVAGLAQAVVETLQETASTEMRTRAASEYAERHRASRIHVAYREAFDLAAEAA